MWDAFDVGRKKRSRPESSTAATREFSPSIFKRERERQKQKCQEKPKKENEKSKQKKEIDKNFSFLFQIWNMGDATASNCVSYISNTDPCTYISIYNHTHIVYT
jgi:hypothetical protein